MSEKAFVSYLPSGSGDGYGFGGGAIVSFQKFALVVGEGRDSRMIAAHVAAALNAYKPFDPKDHVDDGELPF